MNAMTPFALTGEPISDLSRLDVSDVENVKDARHQLRRCRTEREYADWAATWGENLCNHAEDNIDREDFIDPAEARLSEEAAVTGAWDEALAEGRAEMREPMRNAVNALRNLADTASGPTRAAIDDIADSLSTAAEGRA